MLRLPFLVAIALSIAFSGGIASSVYALNEKQGFGAIAVGPWVARPELQTARADPYARAHRALDGRLLLGEAEGLTFTADADSSGRRLVGRCAYVISGATPSARIWTLQVTDAKGRSTDTDTVFPDAIISDDLLRDKAGGFTITAAKRPAPGNWLAMHHAGPIRFVLTLFDTSAAGNAGLVRIRMPAITRGSCDA